MRIEECIFGVDVRRTKVGSRTGGFMLEKESE